MKLVSVDEMRAIEREANAEGLSYAQLMENAGRLLAKEVVSLAHSHDDDFQVLGLVGPGNNGGDTLIALAHLAEKGWKARAYLINRKTAGDQLVRRLKEAQGEVISSKDDNNYHQLSAFLESAGIILDGVLGTGFRLPLKESIAEVLQVVKVTLAGLIDRPYVVAVDCPSGVDSDSGQAADACVPADATIMMAAVKRGVLKLPAFGLAGHLRVVDIGLPPELPTWKKVSNEVVDQGMVEAIMPARPMDAYKGTFGTALIVAGSVNYTGAAYLAGAAAYRVGAGLVTIAVPALLHAVLAGRLPEATWLLLPHEMGVISHEAAEVVGQNLERTTALLIGPGLGLEATTGEFVAELLKKDRSVKSEAGEIGFIRVGARKIKSRSLSMPPLVFDADGLKLLAAQAEWPNLIPPVAVLTPHPGEMSILTGLAVEEIQKKRLEIASHYARQWGHVLVLKGAFSIIASPDGRTATIPVASPALARAGTGDVLAGLIVGLRAQGVEAYEAAYTGAWLHAQAGLYAQQVTGSPASVLAGDVLDCIKDVMSELQLPSSEMG